MLMQWIKRGLDAAVLVKGGLEGVKVSSQKSRASESVCRVGNAKKYQPNGVKYNGEPYGRPSQVRPNASSVITHSPLSSPPNWAKNFAAIT